MIEGIIIIIRSTLTGITIIVMTVSIATLKMITLSINTLIIVTETDALDTQYYNANIGNLQLVVRCKCRL
jgi:hypothetical protein